MGKGRQQAKSELEKLKLAEMSCRDAVYEVARMYVLAIQYSMDLTLLRSIFSVHDDVKDKDFEFELSWVCDDSNREHEFVPQPLLQQVIAKAKSDVRALRGDDTDEDE